MRRRDFATLVVAQTVSGQVRQSSYAADTPDMLASYLARALNAEAARWDRERDKLNSAASIEARNKRVRDAVWKMIHGQPKKTPLNPVATSTFERPGYRVENIMFQSRPNFWVTGNVYRPSGNGPFPGIISPCGHYADARMNPEYQSAYISLVKAGFLVLAYDPIGQGERRQYWDPAMGKTEVGGATTEHSMCGQLLLMMGEDLTQYRVWDGIRAIDYLVTRPDIDPERIGCAGHSGGGTLTMFISAVDERVKVAVINEGGTGHRWPVELRPESRLGPSDVEQNLFPAAALGVDLCDLHVAIAPRPLLALIEDYNPRFNRASEHIRQRYSQLGVAERFATEEATDPHAWTMKLRQATTRWFSRWFLNRPGPESEPDFEVDREQRLYCTPNGSIRHSRQGDTIYTRILSRAAELERERRPERVEQRLRELLAFRRPEGALGVRHLVTTPRKGYSIQKVEFLSEPGIHIPAWVFVPDKRGPDRRALVYLNDAGKQADGGEFGALEKRARSGHLVVAVDVRGIGETRSPHPPPGERPGEFGFLFDVETAMAYMAWFLDRSLLGMRVQDAVRAVDYTLSREDVDRAGVAVIGKGQGALWGLFAAALDRRIVSLECEHSLLSYGELARSDRYLHGANVMIRDVLMHFDLPDVAALLADRELTLVNPVDNMKRAVDLEYANRAYAATHAAFRAAGRADRFKVVRT